jgi:serine/threonine-protein kinase
MLSEGGMGSIWVADHLTLGTQVAVKFIASELVENSAMLARFQLEATSAAQIKSPHVVQMFDHGVTAEGQPYIVMELLHGEDLDRRIERLGRLPLAETALVVRHTCKALGAAHKLRLVHRDIKPANLFVLETEGELFIKVLDFGIAKRRPDGGDLTGVTNTGAMVGTPHFMSPEQVTSARHVDASADLWAVAVVAYSCLLGRRPFEGETVGALCIAIHAGRYLAPTLVDSTLPPALDAWFARALAREPGERFASAKELADTFAASLPADARGVAPAPVGSMRERLSSMPTVVEPAGTSSRPSGGVPATSAPQTLGGASVKTDPGKKRSRAIVGAALAVAVVAGGTAWLAMARRAPPEPGPAASSHGPGLASASAPTPASAPVATEVAAASAAVSLTPIATVASPPTSTVTPTPTATAGQTLPAATPAAPGHAAPHASHTPATTVTTPPPTPTPTVKDRGF